MKITKYPQAHLVLEKDGKRLIIDPGYLSAQQGFSPETFQGADVYLITHQHGDHLDPENIKTIVQDTAVYGNSDVIGKLKEVGVEQGVEVAHLEKFEAGGFEIQAVELPHFPLPNGNPVPPNTGFLIDGVFFHSGDGMDVGEAIQSDLAALALGQPAVSEESIKNVKKMLKQLGVKVYIPIHYDARPAEPEDYRKELEESGVEVRILKNEESTEISV